MAADKIFNNMGTASCIMLCNLNIIKSVNTKMNPITQKRYVTIVL